MTLTASERLTLAAVGMAALVGLGLLLWQRQVTPFTIDPSSRAGEVVMWDDALTRARQVDVNTADAAELERLPEIGPALAQRIVAHRARHGRFRTTEELRQVAGIGPHTMAALAGYVTVGHAARRQE